MQEENRRTQRKTCGSKYGLETKCTYSARTGDRTRAQWCTALGKNCQATCFPSHKSKQNRIFKKNTAFSCVKLYQDKSYVYIILSYFIISSFQHQQIWKNTRLPFTSGWFCWYGSHIVVILQNFELISIVLLFHLKVIGLHISLYRKYSLHRNMCSSWEVKQVSTIMNLISLSVVSKCCNISRL